MGKRMNLFGVGTLVALGLVSFPQAANAWCANQLYKPYYDEHFPDQVIDVYLTTSGLNSITQVGLTVEQGEQYVRTMIDLHNETAASPRLVFAGFDNTTAPGNDLSARPFGITVDGAACAENACNMGPNNRACGNIDKNQVDQNNKSVSKGRVTLLPPGCPTGGTLWNVDGTASDPVGVLLHELGHTLGLAHADTLTCQNTSGWVKGNGPVMTAGVMVSSEPGIQERARGWRRDDLEGLEKVWGAPIDWSVWYWDELELSPTSPSVCELRELPNVARYPVSGSAAGTYTLSNTVESAHLLAVADSNGAINQFAGTESQGVVAFADPLVDSSIVNGVDAGITYGVPGAALTECESSAPYCRDSEFLYTWTSQETPFSYDVRLRWARRMNVTLSPVDWNYGHITPPAGTPDSDDAQSSKKLAVGYDQGHGWFVFTSLTEGSDVYVASVDLDGNQIAVTVVPGAVLDVGKINCSIDGAEESRCVIPFRAADPAGLDVGWYDGFMEADGTFTVLDATTSALGPANTGRVDLGIVSAEEGFFDIRGYRGVAGDRSFELAFVPGIGAANNPMGTVQYAVDTWPIRIASFESTAPGNAGFRMFARFNEPPVECGNDQIECDEECDGVDLDGATCTDFSFSGGSLGCTQNCEYDISNCFECGNGIKESAEDCDGADLGGADCSTIGQGTGSLSCKAQCMFDISGCTGGPDPDPGYPDCTDLSNVGAENCPCEAIDPFEPYGTEAGTPDGVFGADTNGVYYFCPGSDLVCGSTISHGQGEPASGSPICRRCGTQSPGETQEGCPCAAATGECPSALFDPDLTCFGASPDWAFGGTGKCWDKDLVPDHICIEDCSSLIGPDDFSQVCVFDEAAGSPYGGGGPAPFGPHTAHCSASECSPTNFCGFIGGVCTVSNPLTCGDECGDATDCTTLGFPCWYECDLNSKRCLPQGGPETWSCP